MNMPCYLMKSVVLASAVFAALSVGATSAHAVVLKSDVYGHDANGPLYTNQPFGFTSTTAPVSHTIAMPSYGPVARSSHFGAASAAQQTLRAAADLRVISLPEGPNASAKTETHFYKEVVVGAGTSGLGIGAPIRLDLALRLDGVPEPAFRHSFLSGPSTSCLTTGCYPVRTSVLDTASQIWISRCVVVRGAAPRLAGLRSFGRLYYDYEGNDYLGTGVVDTLFSSRRYSWDAYSTVNGSLPVCSWMITMMWQAAFQDTRITPWIQDCLPCRYTPLLETPWPSKAIWIFSCRRMPGMTTSVSLSRPIAWEILRQPLMRN